MLCNGGCPPILLSLLLAVNVSTIVKAEEPSPKYVEVLSAFQTGNTLKVILDLNRCTTVDPGPAAGRVDYQCLQGDYPERHQLLQCSSNCGQFRVPGDGLHPPQPQPRRQAHGAGLKAGGRAGQGHERGRIRLRTAERRAVRLQIGMRLEPFLAASQCDRHPIRHAPMTTSIGLHYLRSASDQDAQFLRAHRCLRTSMDSGAKAVRAAPRSLHSSKSSGAHAA